MAEIGPVQSLGEKKGLAERFLKIFGDVRAGEAVTALILLLDIFLLLTSYYIIKVVREPLVLVSAEKDLQIFLRSNLPEWLRNILQIQKGPQLMAGAAACQALLLIGFIPLYSWLASRVKRLYFLIGVTAFFISNILLFYFLSLAKVPFLGFIFYVWVGIFNVSMIAQFWSFANDVYTKNEGDRLFPIIAIGATAGAPIGSFIAERLKNWPPFQTILLTAGLLVVFLLLSLIVHFRETCTTKKEQAVVSAKVEPMKKGGGFKFVFKNPYVLLLGFLILSLNMVNTSGQFILSDFVMIKARAISPDNMGPILQGFYGNFQLWQSIIAFLLQAFLVSRIVKYTGIKGVILILPIVAFGAYGVIGLGAGLAIVKWLKIAENATDYSIMNTGKAMLWLPTAREEKYKAKQTVDTFFVRFGDFAAAIIFIAGTTVLGLGIRRVAGFNLIIIAVWLLLTFLVLKKHRKLVSQLE
ncbi:MAG: MFS transporter [Candidatus Aminicenantales bacterium]